MAVFTQIENCWGSIEVRRFVILVWGFRPEDDKTTELLFNLLKDADWQIRFTAAQRLGELGHPIQPPLLEALKSQDGKVRQPAVNALGYIPDEQGLDYLETALQDEDKEVRGAVIWALSNKKNMRAIELLIQALQDHEAEVRERAVRRLSWSKDRQAVLPITELFQDENRGVREEAIKAFQGFIKDEQAVQPLILALREKGPNPPAQSDYYDEWAHTRAAAVEALGHQSDARAVEPLIEVFENSNEWQ